MDWCKLWAEWATDPKVQIMPEQMQRRHAMLLCLRCAQETNGLSDEEVALFMRIDATQLSETKALFVLKGFIDRKWKILKWEKRQDYVSPAAQRMRAVRERERNTLRNACEPENERVHAGARSREEIREEEIREDKTPPNPRKRGKPSATAFVVPDFISSQDWEDYERMRASIKKPLTPRAKELAVAKLEQLRATGQDPGAVLRQSIMNSWQGLFPITVDRVNGKPLWPGQKPPVSHITPPPTRPQDYAMPVKEINAQLEQRRKAKELERQAMPPKEPEQPRPKPVAKNPASEFAAETLDVDTETAAKMNDERNRQLAALKKLGETT